MTTSNLPGGRYPVGDFELTRVGYGAMQLAGPGVFGPPKDRDEAIAVLRARGEGQLAGLYGAMGIAPHAGVAVARLGAVLGLTAVSYALSAGLGWLQGYLIAGISERTACRLRQDVEDKLARLPLRYFDRHPHGDILARVANDVDNIDTTFHQVLTQMPTVVFSTAGVIAVMFWLSPLLALFALAAVPVTLVAAALIARRSKGRYDEQWDHSGRLTALAEESFAGHALVQAFGRQLPREEEFRRENERLVRASFRAQFLSGVVLPVIVFVGNLNYVVIAVVGGYWVATGAITLGVVQAFIQYSQQVTSPVATFAGQLNQVQSGMASARRVFEFLDETQEADAGHGSLDPLPSARGVRLSNVCFRYEPETPLIEDLTLDVAAGQTVAIVGPTGAGKTTIVNLLVRFYEIHSGQILLDGVDYRSLSRSDVRRCFGMVLQDSWLFGGTIRDNIGYGRAGATDAEIEAAARAARTWIWAAAHWPR